MPHYSDRELEAKRKAAAKYRETMANPFRRARRKNGETRYLNRREEREHSSLYDRNGNRT